MYLDTSYCSFDAGWQNLHVTLPWDGKQYRIGAWAKGCKADVLNGGDWQCATGDLDIPLVTDLLTAGEETHPIARYAGTIPSEVRTRLAECEQGQLAMLQVCAASPRGIQLLHAAPLLLWYVAPHVLMHTRGKAEQIHQLLGCKQRDLLRMACGRSDSSLLYLLSRIPLPERVEDPYGLLDCILTNEQAVNFLRHKKYPGWDFLTLLRQSAHLLHLPLLQSILLSDMTPGNMRMAFAECRHIVEDVRRMGVQLGIADVEDIITACRDWKQMKHIHDAWVRRLIATDIEKKVAALGNDLPPPPLPGTESIVPIDTVRELLTEGKVMHHCVGGYVQKVRAGGCYIYRMTEPERVTVELRQDDKGRWWAAQVKSFCNRRPDKKTFKALEEWLLGGEEPPENLTQAAD